jgi:AmmeMemoRadiSam system protein B
MNWKNLRPYGLKICMCGRYLFIPFLLFSFFSFFSLPITPPAEAGGALLTPFTGEIRPYVKEAAPVALTPPARAGIAPHHGLASEMISRFYDALPDAELVILIGPDHFRAGRHAITLCPLSWRAGGKILETDAVAAAALSQTKAAGVESLPFRLEHSIGLHVQFIAHRLPKARIVALMVKNSATPRELSRLVDVLSELLAKEKAIMILSMDFSHEKIPEAAKREDDKSISRLLSFKTEALRELDIDATSASWLFLEVLKHRGITDGFVLERTNSSEIIARPDLPCTSYATMLFRER